MMGHSHALFGAATWVGLTGGAATSIPIALNVIPGVDNGIDVAVGAVIVAGAALLPDLDHPQATIARSFPPLSRWLSQGVSAISGGHRGYTHTIWLALAVAFLFLAGGVGDWVVDIGSVPVGMGVGITAIILGALASAAVKLTIGKLGAWPTGIIFGVAAALLLPKGAPWLAIAIGIGYLSHLVGDIVTTEGLLLFRPIPLKIRVPVIGKAGSPIEHILASVFGVYIVAVLCTIGFSAAGVVS